MEIVKSHAKCLEMFSPLSKTKSEQIIQGFCFWLSKVACAWGGKTGCVGGIDGWLYVITNGDTIRCFYFDHLLLISILLILKVAIL